MPPLSTETKKYLASGGALRNGQIPTQRLDFSNPQEPITTANFTASEPLTLPSAPPPVDYRPAIDSSLESLLGAFSATTPEETAASDFQSRILQSIEKLGGKKARSAELEKEAGLPAQRKDLQAVINRITALQAQAASIPEQLQLESEGRGRTVAGLVPLEAGALRKVAIEALGLSAAAAALQGNVSLAEQHIKSTLDAEFQEEETKLEILKQLYTFNRDTLEREDRKRADVLNVVLRERERDLSLRREDEKTKLELVVAAASNSANPAPLSVLERARNAGTPLEALDYLSPYLTNPFEVEAQIVDLAATRASTALTNANIEKALAEIAKIRTETIEEGSISQQRLGEILDNYALTNEILSDPNLETAVGRSSFLDPRNYIPGSDVQLTKNKISQIIALLSLENRQKLKGSGQISDYESRILAQAATALGTNLSDEAFKKELRKIRGVFATSAGLETLVEVTNPKTREKKVGPMSRPLIESAVAQGYTIEYK